MANNVIFTLNKTFYIRSGNSLHLKIKKLYKGNGAPAAYFVESCRDFGLINNRECSEGLNYYSERIHARHLKRLKKFGGGGGYKWKRKRNNDIR